MQHRQNKFLSVIASVMFLLLSVPFAASASQRLFYGTPESGAAPLAVTFTSNGMISSNFYQIDFGDGQIQTISTPSTAHTYTTAGTYTAKFMYAPNQCAGITNPCTQPEPVYQMLDSDVITVSAQAQSSFSANPTAGTQPLVVTFSGIANGSYSIDYGDGSLGPNSVCDFAPCGATHISQTHTYSNIGTYSAQMRDSSGTHITTITVAASTPTPTPTPPTPILCPAGYHANYTTHTCNADTVPVYTPPIDCPQGSHSNGTQCIADAPVCPYIANSLYRGLRDSSGNGSVLQLQRFLASIFNVDQSAIVTGYFGPITENYVMRFQSQNGISAIGIVGPLTRSAIQRTCASL